MDILPPGSLIGKYPITRLMSAGGMGLIYEAVHPVLGSRVVIKTIRSELAHDPSIIERFFKEALATSRIRDERLPQIFDQDRLDDSSPYIVMEYLDGEDLAARLAHGPLDYEYATRIVLEILEVLHRVHQIGIVHRDLKPQNIYLARSDLLGEIPKLLDFGVAHFMGEQATAPGEMMGTPLYMALEQADLGGRIGPWTDVFAAGVVLYECLAGAGKRPWGSPNVMGYLARLKSRATPRPLTELAPMTPPGLAEAVHTALSIEPDQRFPDAARFARAIEPFAQPRTAMFSQPAPPRISATEATIDAGSMTGDPFGIGRAPTPSGSDETVIETSRTGRTGRTNQPGSSMRMRTMTTGALQKLHRRLALLGPERSTPPRVDRLKAGERRHVTLLALTIHIDSSLPETEPEDIDAVVDQVFEVFRRVLARADAHVEPPVGWSLIAAFGHEETREDDAERAVAAARALIAQQRAVDEALGEYGYGLSLRIGLHSGFVTRTARGGRDVVTGDTAEVARHLVLVSPINGICISRETCAIVGTHYHWRPMGPVEVKGRPRPVQAYEIIRDGMSTDVRTRPGAARTFVGRAELLEALEMEYLLASVQSGEVRQVQIVGPPGSGKSRLLDELVRRIAEDTSRQTRVVRVQPVGLQPYGLWAALLRHLLFDTDVGRPVTMDVVARLNQLAGALDDASAAELRRQTDVAHLILGRGEIDAPDQVDPEVFGGRIRSLLALTLTAAGRRTARIFSRPLVLVFDDLHRADSASLELLGAIPGMIRDGQPPLFLLGSRTTAARPAQWVQARELPIGPLGEGEIDQLIDDMAGVHEVSDAVRAMVRSRSGGNPLFIEELVQMLRTRRQLDADEAALADLSPPGSLYGLLLSRLERLPGELRTAVQWLAIAGPEVRAAVWQKVSAELAGQRESRLTPLGELDALTDLGVLDRLERDEGVHRFHQQLLRDAVYGTVLAHNRRLLHLRYAEAIEALESKPDAETCNRLLYHYSHTDRDEKTVHYARQVGRRRLALAAHAEALSALQLAAMLQDRLETPDPAAAVGTLLDLSKALFYLGRLDDSASRAAEALAAVPEGDDRLAARAHAAVARARQYTGAWEAALNHLEQAEMLFDRAERPGDAARTRCMRAFVLRSMGGDLEEALVLARSGWTVLTQRDAAPASVVRAGHDLGNILRALDRHGQAIAVFEHAIRIGEQSGGGGPYARLPWLQACRSGRALSLAAVGRVEEAIDEQRQVYAHAVQIRHRVAQAISSFHLARHLTEAGDIDAAVEMAETSLEVCGEIGMPGRAMKARLLLARLAGDMATRHKHLAAAEFLARDRGDELWFDQTVKPLVRLLRQQGDVARATSLVAEARRRAEVSGDVALAERVAALAFEGG